MPNSGFSKFHAVCVVGAVMKLAVNALKNSTHTSSSPEVSWTIFRLAYFDLHGDPLICMSESVAMGGPV